MRIAHGACPCVSAQRARVKVSGGTGGSTEGQSEPPQPARLELSHLVACAFALFYEGARAQRACRGRYRTQAEQASHSLARPAVSSAHLTFPPATAGVGSATCLGAAVWLAQASEATHSHSALVPSQALAFPSEIPSHHPSHSTGLLLRKCPRSR